VNGLFTMRNTSDSLNSRLVTAYSNSVDDYLDSSWIVFIIAMVSIGISLCGMIPSVFKIHKANNKVLSLFGLISIKDIELLVVKVENFQ